METFAAIIRQHLSALGWTQNDLAKRLAVRSLVGSTLATIKESEANNSRGASGISAGQLSGWFNGHHLPTEDDLMFLTLVLFEGYRERQQQLKSTTTREPLLSYHTWDVVPMFNEMLATTRRAPVDTGSENSIWRRLTNTPRSERDGKLIIAWTPLSGYCPTEGRGYSWELATTVASMLDFDIEWKPYNQKRDHVFDAMMHDLQRKRIDLIGPFLFQVPSRLRDVRLTDSIGFREKLVGLIGAHVDEQKLSTKARPMCTRGDISEIISHVLFPDAILDTYDTESDLLDHLAEHPKTEDGIPRCYVAGIFDAVRILKDYPALKQIDLIPTDPTATRYSLYFPTSFAVARSEPRLVESIDLTLNILKKNGFVFQYLKPKYRKQFKNEFGRQFKDNSIQWEDEDPKARS